MAFLTKRNSGYYIVWIDNNKKRKYLTCKTRIKGDAMKALTQFNIRENPDYKCNMELNTFKDEMINYSMNNHQASTTYLYNFSISLFINTIGNKKLTDYNLLDIEVYKSFRMKTIKPTSLNIELRCLKSMFNLAFVRGYTLNNIAKHIKQIPVYESTRNSISTEKFNNILESTPTNDMIILFTIAYYTGLRIGELVSLKWQNININEKLIYVTSETKKTKNKKNRVIPISDKIIHYFQLPDAGYKDIDYIFTYNNHKYHENHLSKTFKRILRKLNFEEKYNFHCLRHSFISNLIERGVDINTVKELAGHSCIQTTMLYCHSNLANKYKAIEKL